MKLSELVEKNNLDFEVPDVWDENITGTNYEFSIENEEGYDIYVFTNDKDTNMKLEIIIDPTLMRLTYFTTDDRGSSMMQYNQQGELVEYYE